MNRKHPILAAIAGLFGLGPSAGLARVRTRDVAFQFRMGAGSPGDVNRGHPTSIEPVLFSVANPPTAYGQPLVIDTADAAHGVRLLAPGDIGVTQLWGILVRPFPVQQANGTNFGAASLGASSPAPSVSGDAMRRGYILVQLNAGQAAPRKGDPVFIWVAATAGNNVQNQFATAASVGNTAALDTNRYTYNGGPDSAGVVEVIVNY